VQQLRAIGVHRTGRRDELGDRGERLAIDVHDRIVRARALVVDDRGVVPVIERHRITRAVPLAEVALIGAVDKGKSARRIAVVDRHRPAAGVALVEQSTEAALVVAIREEPALGGAAGGEDVDGGWRGHDDAIVDTIEGAAAVDRRLDGVRDLALQPGRVTVGIDGSVEMEHERVAGTPHGGHGLLGRRDRGASVMQIDHGRGGERWDLHPREQRALARLVALDLVREPLRAGLISGEVEVEAIRARDIPAVRAIAQVVLDHRDQQRELEVRTAGDVIVDDLDRAHQVAERGHVGGRHGVGGARAIIRRRACGW